MFLALGIVGAVIFLVIIIIAIVKTVTVKRFNKQIDFGYSKDKPSVSSTTGIQVIDEIMALNPNFLNNELEKTNLAQANRVDRTTNTPLTIQQTLERYPEEKVRLACYLKCLKQFGRDRVELEFPIQVGSKKCFIDVAVFNCLGTNARESAEHNILNLKYIFECKKSHPNANIRDKNGNPETMSSIMNNGLRQLKSYMAVCPNLCERTTRDENGVPQTKILGLGCLTCGDADSRFFKKVINASTGNMDFEQIQAPKWY